MKYKDFIQKTKKSSRIKMEELGWFVGETKLGWNNVTEYKIVLKEKTQRIL